MNSKARINKAQWTNFWNGLEIYIKKPPRFLKRYKTSSDKRKLRQIGIDEITIDKVMKGFSYYQEPNLQFHKFSSFFRKDPETVLSWLGVTNISDGFLRLFRKIHFNNFKKAKAELAQLYFLHELNKNGEGRRYEIKYKGHGSITRIPEATFSALLSSKHENATYKNFKKYKVGQSTIIPFLKVSGKKKVYKFIRFIKESGKIYVDISVNSQKELNLLKYKISEHFKSFLDTPETIGNFTKLLDFLKSGESSHYKLIGVNFLDGEFKVSIFPQHNRLENIAAQQLYRKKFSSATQAEIGKVMDIRIANNQITTKNQVFIHFFGYMTEGIIGALTLSLDDRRLNMKERKKIKEDFSSDFDIPLSTLISFGRVSEEEIYKSLLQNLPHKHRKLQLRSDVSLRIYKTLVKSGLISAKFESQDKAGFCFNQDCRISFQRQWNKKICPICGDPLFNDKKIVVSKIEEKKVVEYIYSICSDLGLDVEIFEKSLLGRKIFGVEIRKDNKSICILPITKTLNDHQLEVLRFRFTNVILVTSKDDVDQLKLGHVEVLELYKLVMNLNSPRSLQYVKSLMGKMLRNRLFFIRSVADTSATRLINTTFYIDKNKVSKNLGAELFEADVSIVLSYIFGNTIWLGANKRGKEYPDGITGFPLTKNKNGCLIWDTKFSETNRVSFGTYEKNKKYVVDGKANQTLKNNGGLKGFVFISNANSPAHFTSKFSSLARGRVMKISFIQVSEIIKIFNHYKDHEADITRNTSQKDVFIESMKKLFFKTTRATKATVLKERNIDTQLSNNKVKYLELQTPEVQV